MPNRLESVHFISGLPRSGSTLLSALLRQNPRFRANITSPVAMLCAAVHQQIAGTGEFAVHFDEKRCAQILRGLFDIYYAHVPATAVVFDTNRTWTSRVALLSTLYPHSRIICCVRDIGWILDSIERMRVEHPLKLSRIFTQHSGDSVYTRVDALMNAETGLVGAAWSTLREAWFSDAANRLIVVPYDTFVRTPAKTLQGLYEALDEPLFPHDFQNVVFESRRLDEERGMPDLHTVRPEVAYLERQPIIPPDLFTKFSKTHFWSQVGLNTRGATIL